MKTCIDKEVVNGIVLFPYQQLYEEATGIN